MNKNHKTPIGERNMNGNHGMGCTHQIKHKSGISHSFNRGNPGTRMAMMPKILRNLEISTGKTDTVAEPLIFLRLAGLIK